MRSYDSIQELRRLSDEIFNCVDDYLKYDAGCIGTDDNQGVYIAPDLSVEILSVHEAGNLTDFYPLDTLLRPDDMGGWETDIDVVEDIAAHYVFVR